jgi:uncharacterized membrane protein YdfJ with MMPL/SSD domain
VLAEATVEVRQRRVQAQDVQQVKNLGGSRDHQTVQLQVLADINLGTPGPAQHLVAGLRHASQASALPHGLHAHLAGQVAAQADVSQASQRTVLTQIMLLILTLGAGTDYGLFLVFRVREEELRAGRSSRDAVTHALSRVGESITFSAATVIAALLTLLLAVFGL